MAEYDRALSQKISTKNNEDIHQLLSKGVQFPQAMADDILAKNSIPQSAADGNGEVALVIEDRTQRYKLHEVLTTNENGTPLFKSETTNTEEGGPLRNDAPLGDPSDLPVDNSIPLETNVVNDSGNIKKGTPTSMVNATNNAASTYTPKGRNYDTVTIAAPVEINGKRGNMAVVVKRTKGNRYKVHRILTPEGGVFTLPEMANAEMNTVGAVTNNSQSLGGSTPAITTASMNSIPNIEGDVNQDISGDGRQESMGRSWDELVLDQRERKVGLRMPRLNDPAATSALGKLGVHPVDDMAHDICQ